MLLHGHFPVAIRLTYEVQLHSLFKTQQSTLTRMNCPDRLWWAFSFLPFSPLSCSSSAISEVGSPFPATLRCRLSDNRKSTLPLSRCTEGPPSWHDDSYCGYTVLRKMQSTFQRWKQCTKHLKSSGATGQLKAWRPLSWKWEQQQETMHKKHCPQGH